MLETTGHLIVGRRLLEQVVITVPPSDVPTTITVCVEAERSGSNHYRLGFRAPKRVQIVRAELTEETAGT